MRKECITKQDILDYYHLYRIHLQGRHVDKMETKSIIVSKMETK